MTEAQREEILRHRKQCCLPWHTPPHFGSECDLYHITAACYEHTQILYTPGRLAEFESELLTGLAKDETTEVRAWVILPNHYHLLLKTQLPKFGKWIHRLHNSMATRWNGQDGKRGRKVWHRYADRRMRGEIHYYRTLNYIHANPVKHGFAKRSQDWPWSSFFHYEQEFGREALVDWWKQYPVIGYGKGWDD